MAQSTLPCKLLSLEDFDGRCPDMRRWRSRGLSVLPALATAHLEATAQSRTSRTITVLLYHDVANSDPWPGRVARQRVTDSAEVR